MLDNNSPGLTRLYSLLKLEQRSLAAHKQTLATCPNNHQQGIKAQIELAEDEIQRLTLEIASKKPECNQIYWVVK